MREKYGDDVLIKKDESEEEEESNSYDSEVDHSSSSSGGESEDVGPRFDKNNSELSKPAEKVEEVKEDGPIKITKKRMMPAAFIPDKHVEKEE